MSELRILSSDPRAPLRLFDIGRRSGGALAVVLVSAGVVMAFGLFAAPDLISDLARSADRLALRETRRIGGEAFDSVRRRVEKLSTRLAADELLLARVGSAVEVALPGGFPPDAAPADARAAGPATDPVDALDLEVGRLARRLREGETYRRRLSGTNLVAEGRDVLRIPSRSPVEPSIAVPIAHFGVRISPLTRREEFYGALGLAAPAGAAVFAPAQATVRFAGVVPSKAGAAWRPLGIVVVLEHDARTSTVYGHLQKALVRRGQLVRRGDSIGRVGQSGWATSPQLRYEVRHLVDGRWIPVDPRLFVLDADWITAAEVRNRLTPPDDADLPAVLR